MMETTKSAELLRIARNALGKRSAKAEEGAEAGFTLIELMVVLLIMAILLAIAIPTFLGVKGGAQDRAAQSNLTNGLTNAEAVYQQNGTSYGATIVSTIAALTAAEPNLTFISTTVPSSATNQISVAIGDIPTGGTGGAQQIVMVDYSPNNQTCWAVSNSQDESATASTLGAAPAGTWYGDWTIGTSAATSCNAGAAFTSATAKTAATASSAGWYQSYTAVPSPPTTTVP